MSSAPRHGPSGTVSHVPGAAAKPVPSALAAPCGWQPVSTPGSWRARHPGSSQPSVARQQPLPRTGPAPAPGPLRVTYAPHLTPVRPPAFSSALILDSGLGPHPASPTTAPPTNPPGHPFTPLLLKSIRGLLSTSQGAPQPLSIPDGPQPSFSLPCHLQSRALLSS